MRRKSLRVSALGHDQITALLKWHLSMALESADSKNVDDCLHHSSWAHLLMKIIDDESERLTENVTSIKAA